MQQVQLNANLAAYLLGLTQLSGDNRLKCDMCVCSFFPLIETNISV